VISSLTDLSGNSYINGSQGWSASDASTVCSLYSSGQYLNGSVFLSSLLTDILSVGHYIYSGAGSSNCIYHITGYLVKYPATYNIIGVVDGLITSMNVCPAISTSTTTIATTTTTTFISDAGYYNCGHGCFYYSYNPGCLPCTPVTTTTTTAASSYYGYIVDIYTCGSCSLYQINVNIKDTHLLLLNRYYWDEISGYIIKIIDIGVTIGSQLTNCTTLGSTSCAGETC
jgi:hypothetical protein